MTQNQIAYQNLKETQRANLAREIETRRSNIARETETKRSNIQSETIGFGNLNQRIFEYSDQAAFDKLVKTAKAAESSAKALDSGTKAVQRVFNPVSWFTGK
jgi:hypothetical protein